MALIIIGYGSAGKRHARIALELGLQVRTVDPVQEADYKDLSEVDDSFDLAVISSPPDLHVDHVLWCLERGIERILCEKPMSGFSRPLSEIPNLWPTCFGFNWRFHHRLESLSFRPDEPASLVSIQTRGKLPPWGLLLDHVSHDLDILKGACGLSAITRARKIGPFGYAIHGKTGRGKELRILDLAFPSRRKFRVAFLALGKDTISLDPDPAMHRKMWLDFLTSQEKIAKVSDAEWVQEKLWKIKKEVEDGEE